MEIIYCPLADSWLCRARLSSHRNSGYKTSVAERLQRRALQGRSPSGTCFTRAGVSKPGLQLCKTRRPATIYWAGVALGYPLPEAVLLGCARRIRPPPMWNYWLWMSFHSLLKSFPSSGGYSLAGCYPLLNVQQRHIYILCKTSEDFLDDKYYMP